MIQALRRMVESVIFKVSRSFFNEFFNFCYICFIFAACLVFGFSVLQHKPRCVPDFVGEVPVTSDFFFRNDNVVSGSIAHN